jgi:hypothetical protein
MGKLDLSQKQVENIPAKSAKDINRGATADPGIKPGGIRDRMIKQMDLNKWMRENRGLGGRDAGQGGSYD